MGFDDHGHRLRAGVLAQFTQPVGDSSLRRLIRRWALVGFRLAPKHPDVWRPKSRRQIDETPGIGELLVQRSVAGS